MKQQNEVGWGGALAATIIFAIAAIYSYNNDMEDGVIIPISCSIIFFIWFIVEAVKESNKSSRAAAQDSFSKSITYDKSLGDGDLKIYFNTEKKKATINTTKNDSSPVVVEEFEYNAGEKTDSYLVAWDKVNHNLLRASYTNSGIAKKLYNYKDVLSEKGVRSLNEPTGSLKSFGDFAFLTDDANKFVVIITKTSIYTYQYKELVSISIEEDGNSVYNKSIAGALVGGALVGGVGAIVGANTAQATENKEISKICVKILVQDSNRPTIEMVIYSGFLRTKELADMVMYEGCMEEANGIKDLFSVIIDIAEKDSRQQIATPTLSSPAPANTSSVADELLKLAQLKDSGILSEEEFNVQKNILLGR